MGSLSNKPGHLHMITFLNYCKFNTLAVLRDRQIVLDKLNYVLRNFFDNILIFLNRKKKLFCRWDRAPLGPDECDLCEERSFKLIINLLRNYLAPNGGVIIEN